MSGDYFALCLALEELGKVDQSVAITLRGRRIARRDAGVPLRQRGPEAGVVAPVGNGKALGAFGLTEAGGGTDAGATKTTAKLDDGHWVINGSKQFITNSGTDITKLVTVPPPSPGKPMAGKRSRRSWCRSPPMASPPSLRTTRSAGTPPTPTR